MRIKSGLAAITHSAWMPRPTAIFASFIFALLMAAPALADSVTAVITFVDGSEGLSATTSGPVPTPTCDTALEQCTVSIPPPPGFGFFGYFQPPPPGPILPVIFPPDTLFIGDANGNISDEIVVHNLAVIFPVDVTFFSDLEGTTLGLCSEHVSTGQCIVTENGAIQYGGQLSFFPGVGGNSFTIDLYFQSDVNEAPPVPEPASILLLGTGLAALARKLRR